MSTQFSPSSANDDKVNHGKPENNDGNQGLSLSAYSQPGYAPPPMNQAQHGLPYAPAGYTQQGMYPNVAPVGGNVVYVQPQQTTFNDHLVFSIMTMLFCCFIIGLIALLKSLEVQKANQTGNPNARLLSDQALRYNKIALGVGIGFNVLWIALVIGLAVILPSVRTYSYYNSYYDYK